MRPLRSEVPQSPPPCPRLLTGAATDIAAESSLAGRAATNMIQINAGRISVNGALTSNITIANGGTLGGSGTINGNVNNNGVLAPGNSVGTLTVNGNYTPTPTSIFKVFIEPSLPGQVQGPASKIVVVGGSLTLGGILSIDAAPGQYKQGVRYDFADATTITGNFDSIATPFVGPYAVIVKKDLLYLGVEQLPFSPLVGGFPGNSAAVGNYFGSLPLSSLEIGSDLGEVYGILTVGLTDANNGPTPLLEQALESMSPGRMNAANVVVQNDSALVNQICALHLFNFRQGATQDGQGASSQASAIRSSSGFNRRESLSKRTEFGTGTYNSVSAQAEKEHRYLFKSTDNRGSVWMQGFGHADSQRARKTDPAFSSKTSGVMAGVDYRPTHDKLMGLGLGSFKNWVNTQLSFDKEASHTQVMNHFATLYGTWFYDGFYVDGAMTGVRSTYDSKQHIAFSTINRIASAKHQGFGLVPHIGAGYTMAFNQLQITPFMGADYIYNTEKAYQTTGANGLNQDIHRKTSVALRSEIGVKVAQTFEFEQGRWSPMASLNYNYKKSFKGGKTRSNLVNQPGFFTVENFSDTYAINTGVGVLLEWKESLSVQANLDPQFGSRYRGCEVGLKFLSKF